MSKSSALQICQKLSVAHLSSTCLFIMSRIAYQASGVWYDITSVYWCAGAPLSKRLGSLWRRGISGCKIQIFVSTTYIIPNSRELCFTRHGHQRSNNTRNAFSGARQRHRLAFKHSGSCSTTKNTLDKINRLSNDRSLYNKFALIDIDVLARSW